MSSKFVDKLRWFHEKFKWRIMDSYILKKFLGSFFYSITLLMTVIIVFDISENINLFIERDASLHDIIFKYYLNFIPYFINLFIPLFTFISVIWFTSKLSSNNEIISFFNAGVDFYRFLMPYLVGSVIIVAISFAMANFVIPRTNENLFEFKDQYTKRKFVSHSNIHVKNSSNTYVYIERWQQGLNEGNYFTYEKLGDKQIEYKLSASSIRYLEDVDRWELRGYTKRRLVDGVEIVETGQKMDTVFSITPNDFNQDENIIETMSYRKLRDFIKSENEKGSSLVKVYEIEKHKRIANPVGALIMALLGLSVAARKTRRGVGVHVFIGLAIAFSFVFFQQVTKVFAISGSLSPALASWMPNILYAFVCAYLLKFIQK